MHRLVRPTPWPGSSGTRRKALPGQLRASGTRRLATVPTGASGPGRWKWFSGTQAPPWEAPSSGRLPGPGGERHGLRRPETCLTVGRCELGGGPPWKASRPALPGAGEAKQERYASRQVPQWRPGAGPQPTGGTPTARSRSPARPPDGRGRARSASDVRTGLLWPRPHPRGPRPEVYPQTPSFGLGDVRAPRSDSRSLDRFREAGRSGGIIRNYFKVDICA